MHGISHSGFYSNFRLYLFFCVRPNHIVFFRNHITSHAFFPPRVPLLILHGIVLPLGFPKDASLDLTSMLLKEAAVFFVYLNLILSDCFSICCNVLISLLSLLSCSSFFCFFCKYSFHFLDFVKKYYQSAS